MTRKPHPVWDNKDALGTATIGAKSIGDVLANLGMNRNSGNYQTLKSRFIRYNIPIPVYDQKSNPSKLQGGVSTPIGELFANTGIKRSSYRLKKVMVEHFGIPNLCSVCGQGPTWNGKPLTLELDHVDGNNLNNELNNLRIICGHCHSQTDNFCGKNISNRVYSYCKCGKRISKGSTNCLKHNGELLSQRALDTHKYPPLEEIYVLYLELGSFVALGKRLGVSDNGVRKHIRRMGVSIPLFKQGLLV